MGISINKIAQLLGWSESTVRAIGKGAATNILLNQWGGDQFDHVNRCDDARTAGINHSLDAEVDLEKLLEKPKGRKL